MRLTLLDQEFAVARLAPTDPTPAWVVHGSFFSVTRTPEELSVVGPAETVPGHIQAHRDWRCLRVAGVLDLSLTGVLVSILTPLAAAGISVFAISTYDTDYVLVRGETLMPAIERLSEAGHEVVHAGR